MIFFQIFPLSGRLIHVKQPHFNLKSARIRSFFTFTLMRKHETDVPWKSAAMTLSIVTDFFFFPEFPQQTKSAVSAYFSALKSPE